MSTRSLFTCALLAAATATVAAPGGAAADAGDHAHPHVHDNPRLGFFGGFGVYAGEISCSGEACDGVREAGGLDGHVGYAFNAKLALMGEVWAMDSRKDNLSIAYINSSVGVRYWLVPILWLQAGLGSGHARIRYTGPLFEAEATSDNIATLQLAAGLELIRGKRFALDLQVRIAQGASEDGDGTQVSTGRMTGLGVGFTWF